MPQNYTVLVDDQDSQIRYLCPTLRQQVVGSYSNNTWSTIRADSCKSGWFEYTFYGTGVRLEIPIAHPSQDVQVTLDGTPFNTQSDGTFESPILPDGRHTVSYALGNVSLIPVFDYLTINAGPSTPLNGKTLIVDDADSQISFKGNWSRTPPKPITWDYSTSLYRDTAHWSSTVGDTLEFEFTGTSVSVFGLAANATGSNNITLSYSIDGVTKTQPVPQEMFDSVPMSQLFHANLTAGKHTLVVNLTQITLPRVVGLDFIAYNTSVGSVTALPGYVAQPASSSTPGVESSGSSSNNHKWTIVGSVFGVLFVVAVVLISFLVWRSRRSARRSPAVTSKFGSYGNDADIETTKQASF